MDVLYSNFSFLPAFVEETEKSVSLHTYDTCEYIEACASSQFNEPPSSFPIGSNSDSSFDLLCSYCYSDIAPCYQNQNLTCAGHFSSQEKSHRGSVDLQVSLNSPVLGPYPSLCAFDDHFSQLDEPCRNQGNVQAAQHTQWNIQANELTSSDAQNQQAIEVFQPQFEFTEEVIETSESVQVAIQSETVYGQSNPQIVSPSEQPETIQFAKQPKAEVEKKEEDYNDEVIEIDGFPERSAKSKKRLSDQSLLLEEPARSRQCVEAGSACIEAMSNEARVTLLDKHSHIQSLIPCVNSQGCHVFWIPFSWCLIPGYDLPKEFTIDCRSLKSKQTVYYAHKEAFYGLVNQLEDQLRKWIKNACRIQIPAWFYAKFNTKYSKSLVHLETLMKQIPVRESKALSAGSVGYEYVEPLLDLFHEVKALSPLEITRLSWSVLIFMLNQRIDFRVFMNCLTRFDRLDASKPCIRFSREIFLVTLNPAGNGKWMPNKDLQLNHQKFMRIHSPEENKLMHNYCVERIREVLSSLNKKKSQELQECVQSSNHSQNRQVDFQELELPPHYDPEEHEEHLTPCRRSARSLTFPSE
jgi:hypothetical protein